MKSLTSLFLIAISVGLFYLHIDPRYQTVQQLQIQQEQYQDALDKASELSVVKDELLTKYNNLPQEDLQKLSRIVPDKVNSVKLITDINEVGAKYGIPIESIKVVEEQVDNGAQIVDEISLKPYVTTAISFKFSASYRDLVSFLKDLEKSLQIIDISSVKFGLAKDDKSQLYDYDVVINTYWLRSN
jgi:Tfp pilus assembly protein PilO